MSDEELRALAEAATPGPWEVVGESVVTDGNAATVAVIEAPDYEEDAAYIAAANPTAVLDLLDRLAAAEARASAAEARLAGLRAAVEGLAHTLDNENWRAWGLPQGIRHILAEHEATP